MNKIGPLMVLLCMLGCLSAVLAQETRPATALGGFARSVAHHDCSDVETKTATGAQYQINLKNVPLSNSSYFASSPSPPERFVFSAIDNRAKAASPCVQIRRVTSVPYPERWRPFNLSKKQMTFAGTSDGDWAAGEASQQPATSAQEEAQELAKKLSNPVASLISVPFQGNVDFGLGAGPGFRFTLNFQPVIPFALSPRWNLISRTIVPMIHQHDVSAPGRSESGLGDLTQSFFFSPNKSEPFVWAVGPVVLIPTAKNDFLGNKQLGLGPTFLILKQQHGWTYGILLNHIWKVAGSDSHARVNATFAQPFLSYTTKDAWTYSINTESSYDWTGKHWGIPIHPGFSKLVRFGKQPVSFGGALRCWVTSPRGGPTGCGFRFIVTPLFPKK